MGFIIGGVAPNDEAHAIPTIGKWYGTYGSWMIKIERIGFAIISV